LLQDREVSKFHRIQSDEIWYFHQGSALELLLIVENELQVVLLGNNIENGETPQTVIPANTWFASRVKNSEGHSLMSCSVAPGFDFMDFEMAERQSLLQEFPHLNETIIELT
jgi:predicted cupin superfamily sugar epimerase